MGSEEERARFLSWWEASGGGNTSLRAVAEQAFTCGARKERMDCIAVCRKISEWYPTEIFPEDGQSLDCKSARMARLTAENIEREITERSNAKLTGSPASGESELNAWLGDRISELEKQHGSLRAAAKVLGCDAGYLSRLRSGEKENPSAILLKRMGLRRVIAYERIKSPNAEITGG